MGLIPWKSRESGVDLFDDLEDFQREMNRLLDLKLNRSFKTGNGSSVWAPAVDILDEKDHVRVRADIPGMKREDIEVSWENNRLTLKGEKKDEREVKDKDYVRSERYYGAFHRTFSLPEGIDAAKVNATYKDGVLDVILPKKEGAKPKQIKVDVK